MKTHRITFLLFTLIFLCANAMAQNGAKLLVLPVTAIGLDDATAQTAESLLRSELLKNGTYQLISEKETYSALDGSMCTEIPCAVETGKAVGADKAIATKLSALGAKVIVQYMLIDVNNGELMLVDNATSSTIENLDAVMKRIADSITQLAPVAKSARIDNIMESESVEPPRRSMRRFTSYSFGYLFPQKGYDDDERSFTMDIRLGAEMNNAEFGMQLAARNGFAVNIFSSYLIGKTDVSPYIGGALGFHWVNHDYGYEYITENGTFVEDERREDGLEFTANTGLRLLRTYDFQLLMNFSYLHTFNDFKDRAILFTIGILR